MTPFRLARVLRLRGRLRSLRQLEAAELDAACDALVAEGQSLRGERERALAELTSAVTRGDETTSVALAARYEAALRDRERVVHARLASARDRLAGKRAEIEAERREERKLEHLRERHRATEERAAGRAAERLIDDLASSRYAAERREDGRGG